MRRKPCKLSCPKCGSLDIHRQHEWPGEYDAGFEPQERTTPFVKIRRFDSKILAECIVHHCRDCQYEWETAPLKALAKAELGEGK